MCRERRDNPHCRMKGLVQLEIHRIGLSRAAISPFVPGETHQRRDCDVARHVPSQDTHSQLELACRKAMRELVEEVKQQQEKIDYLLLELEAIKRVPRDSLNQGNAHKTRRTDHRGCTTEQRLRSRRQELKAWQSQTKTSVGDEGSRTSSSQPRRREGDVGTQT